MRDKVSPKTWEEFLDFDERESTPEKLRHLENATEEQVVDYYRQLTRRFLAQKKTIMGKPVTKAIQ
jgi:hypothetical protein